jgi:hypothetical protein
LLSKNIKIKIYKTIILPVVWYGCETWSLTWRKKHRLKLFENMVLRRIFGPRRDEVTREWRKLHKEEINVMLTKYCSGDQIKTNWTDRACSTYGGEEMCIQGFGGENWGKETTWETYA